MLFGVNCMLRSGKAIVSTVHDVRRQVAILNRGWEEKNLRQFYRDCDALFVHSRSQSEELQQFAGVSAENIFEVPHGLVTFGEISQRNATRLRERVLGDPKRKLIPAPLAQYARTRTFPSSSMHWPNKMTPRTFSSREVSRLALSEASINVFEKLKITAWKNG